ncbi:MAG: MgtC/SapB family protein [Deltaproteobacteria bacterium]|nr:MgtC/SapB family protein [Deltaproteobacteria bacterium]
MFTSEVIICRLLFACLCGAMIGIEREKHGRPAGLRTHLLVSLGAATIMIISLSLLALPVGEAGREMARVDPGRIAAQVVAGIGFLGAGAIIQARRMISGLTTAACLWVAASIGLAAGMGSFLLAGAVTMLSLISLYLLKWLEHALPKDRYHLFVLKCHYHPQMLSRVEKMALDNKVKIISYGFTHDKEKELLLINLEVRLTDSRIPQGLMDRFTNEPGILTITWR